jgi:hypothetical protein
MPSFLQAAGGSSSKRSSKNLDAAYANGASAFAGPSFQNPPAAQQLPMPTFLAQTPPIAPRSKSTPSTGAFAGPRFQNTPAAQQLPMPTFLAKSTTATVRSISPPSSVVHASEPVNPDSVRLMSMLTRARKPDQPRQSSPVPVPVPIAASKHALASIVVPPTYRAIAALPVASTTATLASDDSAASMLFLRTNLGVTHVSLYPAPFETPTPSVPATPATEPTCSLPVATEDLQAMLKNLLLAPKTVG